MRPLPLLLLAACSAGLSVHDKTYDAPPTDAVETGVDTTTPPGDDDDTTVLPNDPPIADAGDDQTALVADQVSLDGSSSYDPNGDSLFFEWTLIELPAGSSSFLINENRATPSFYADREGLYKVELIVDDGLETDVDEVLISVAAPNEGPVANAGPDQVVDVGDRVALNGSSSYDPDGGVLQFSWSLTSTPAGSTATLDNPSSALPQFTADTAGTYVISLEVSDGVTVSLPDEVRVTAQDPGDSDCLSCATAQTELRRRMQAGDLASSAGLVLLPFLVLLWQRKRED